jgi:O-antigen ligase
LLVGTSAGGRGADLFELVAGLSIVAGCIYALWLAPPAYTLSIALLLSPFSSNWGALGLPGGVAPDRIVAVIGILAVLLHAPGLPAGRSVALRPVHGVLGVAVLYVLVSSAVAGTLSNHDAIFNLIDAFGVLPFLVFLVAPVAFQTERERRILLIAFVALGGYLGLTTLFESLHLDALVFPKYILNASVGVAAAGGRARGPFAAAVENGFGLYGCACVAALAAAIWKDWRARAFAMVVTLLCLLGAFLTLQRSVWIATVIATVMTLLCMPRFRRWIVPILVAGAVAVLFALALIPGLSENASTRATDSIPVWERENLTVAAVNMITARPLTGFGWGTFTEASGPYFRQSASYPLIGTTEPCHNTYLSFAAELGLIGLSLWLLSMLWGVGGAILSRANAIYPWRMTLLAVFVFYMIVIAFVPPQTGFPILVVWLLAGVAAAPQRSTRRKAHTGNDADERS